MKKSNLITLLVFLVLIPMTLYIGKTVPGRGYYLVATVMLLELMVPFLTMFEGRRPQAREIVLMAVLCVLAIVGRVAIPFPTLKAIFGIIMISGIALGPESGFIIGAVSALASNFFYGQGAYLPWQMMAYGAGGMLAGFLFSKRMLPRKSWIMALFGFLSIVLFVGPLLDSSYLFLVMPDLSLTSLWASLVSGFPVNMTQGIATGIVMFLLGRPLLDKIERVKIKYGMLEGENGI